MKRFVKILLMIVGTVFLVVLAILQVYVIFMAYLTYDINTSGLKGKRYITGTAVSDLSSPSVTTDTVYFEDNNVLFGVDAKTGKLKKRFQQALCRQFVNGKIYQLDMKSNLSIINPSSGRIIKRLRTNIKGFGKCIEYDDKFLFMDGEKTVYAYSLDTGKCLWEFVAPDDIENYLVVGSGVACFGTMTEGFNPPNPEIYGINVNTGKKIWSYKADNPSVRVLPDRSTSSGKVAYIELRSHELEPNGHLDAIDIKKGKRIWRFTPDSGYISGDPVIFKGFMYVGSDDNKFYSIDLKTGHKIWSFSGSRMSDDYAAKAAADTDNAYFASIDNYLYAIDRDNGKVRWKTNQLGDISNSNPVAKNGFVYIGADDTLFALDRQTGRTKWKFRIK